MKFLCYMNKNIILISIKVVGRGNLCGWDFNFFLIITNPKENWKNNFCIPNKNILNSVHTATGIGLNLQVNIGSKILFRC